MKMHIIAVMCAGLFACQSARGAETNKTDEMMPGFDDIEMKKVTILKVFSAQAEGAKYRAYLVKWNNQEVVVQDIFCGRERKAGDSVKVMVQTIDSPEGKILQFVLCDFDAMMPKFDSSEDAKALKNKQPASRPKPGMPATPSKAGSGENTK